jgi:peptidyl-Lys metalloendopeptidase
MTFSKLAKVSIAVAAALACYGANAASNPISVDISTAKTVLGSSDDVVVNVKLTNTTSKNQHVLKWATPFIAVEEPLFDVYRDGVKVDYLGRHYKRGTPKSGDYFLLKPGKTYSGEVELSSLYDMSVTGTYSIRYRAASLNLFSASFDRQGVAGIENDMGEMESDAMSMFISGRNAFAVAEKRGSTTTGTAGLTYSGCTSSQASTIASAIGAATTMASDSLAYLNAGKKASRYTTWFGTYVSSRYTTVKSHYSAINTAFTSKPVVVDCSCKESYFAYVYPTQPYKIYVCNAFWSAPLNGTDSKGGTLVHEMSHFNAVASTDDWAYGQSGAKSLAISNPTKAIDNADSHEYFAENSPALN